MALVLKDRVRETATVIGTGDAALLGAVTGFQSFSVVGNTNVCYYTIADQSGGAWEVGIGTYSTTGPTLARTTVLASSDNNNKVVFTGGTKDVFLTYPSERAVYLDANGNLEIDGNVVIAVNNSSNALRITQTGTGNALVVEDSANPDSTPFVVAANGSVGIGTSTPAGVSLFIQNDSQASEYLRTAANNSQISLQRVNTTNASPSIVASGDDLGIIAFDGYDGTTTKTAAWIRSSVDGTPGTNDMPGRLVFSTTADGASSPTERMRIDSAGQVGIGATALVGYSLYSAKNITGSVNSYGFVNTGIIQSDVTSQASYFTSSARTQATSFTLTALQHYLASQGTFGAGSTVTKQYGFNASSNLTGATNNYGFYSSIASGTGRYNFYAAGSADNYFSGNTGFGGLPFAGAKVVVGAVDSSATTYAFDSAVTIPSTSTTAFYSFISYPTTAAAAFTLPKLSHFEANAPAFGAGSTVTTQCGFSVSSTLTGATNNYGFWSNIASGTGRYNFYAAGSAANYFAGDMQFAKTVTAAGTTGAQTINKTAGTVNFAAAATSLVVTNSLVTANSIIVCTVGTNDTTMKSVSAVAGAGSFTLYANAAATAETRVNFIVIN